MTVEKLYANKTSRALNTHVALAFARRTWNHWVFTRGLTTCFAVVLLGTWPLGSCQTYAMPPQTLIRCTVQGHCHPTLVILHFIRSVGLLPSGPQGTSQLAQCLGSSITTDSERVQKLITFQITPFSTCKMNETPDTIGKRAPRCKTRKQVSAIKSCTICTLWKHLVVLLM